jgi:PEP-CTERM motif
MHKLSIAAVGAVAIAMTATPAFSATLLGSATAADGHVYELWSEGAQVLWATGEAHAVSRGGHLASIANAAENAFVYDLVDGFLATVYNSNGQNQFGPWLGGIRTGPSSFAWSDGTAFSFTAWGAGEPNNVGGAETNIHLWATGSDPIDQPGEGATWNDLGALSGQFVTAYVAKLPGAIPEPGSWAMMIVGFGAAGAAMRLARRGKALPATA